MLQYTLSIPEQLHTPFVHLCEADQQLYRGSKVHGTCMQLLSVRMGICSCLCIFHTFHPYIPLEKTKGESFLCLEKGS